MRIQGIWAVDHSFHPDQWVNVYVDRFSSFNFYCSCQIKDLSPEDDDFELYALELTDDDGNVITVEVAERIRR